LSTSRSIDGQAREDGDRPARLAAIRHESAEVAAKAGRIYAAMLDRSRHIRSGNFAAIGVEDLELLFDLYDAEFFGGLLGRMLREDGAGAPGLRLSSRLTRAAGKTTMTRRRVRSPAGPAVRVEYEIAVSTLLLFQTFRDVGRPITVGGLVCRDRLEALQRIMEHELLHLAEFLAWGRSSCARANFHTLSRRIFGHEGTTHDLVTPREVAAERHGIRVGDRVRFEHEGRRLSGLVNRITRRATVLVEDPRGRPFSDGRRYATYYVPIPWLRGEDGPD
jgi:hypothetical protein